MIRRIIQIDEEKCNGCGACAKACHEGAIGMVNGKAKLLRDDYCDGLGDCLPTCPTGAITFVEREAAAYDEAAVLARKQEKKPQTCGCPGSQARVLQGSPERGKRRRRAQRCPLSCGSGRCRSSWCRSGLPTLTGRILLIAADCSAYAYGNFHQDFIRGRITLIGCPKLDGVDYSEKLTEILRSNDIRSVTVVRMEVPCCGGLQHAAETALRSSGKHIPWQVVTIRADGTILENTDSRR